MTREELEAIGKEVEATMPALADALDHLMALADLIDKPTLRDEIKEAFTDALAAYGYEFGDLIDSVICPSCREAAATAIAAATGVSTGEEPS
jgi:hypothetical protein